MLTASSQSIKFPAADSIIGKENEPATPSGDSVSTVVSNSECFAHLLCSSSQHASLAELAGSPWAQEPQVKHARPNFDAEFRSIDMLNLEVPRNCALLVHEAAMPIIRAMQHLGPSLKPLTEMIYEEATLRPFDAQKLRNLLAMGAASIAVEKPDLLSTTLADCYAELLVAAASAKDQEVVSVMVQVCRRLVRLRPNVATPDLLKALVCAFPDADHHVQSLTLRTMQASVKRCPELVTRDVIGTVQRLLKTKELKQVAAPLTRLVVDC